MAASANLAATGNIAMKTKTNSRTRFLRPALFVIGVSLASSCFAEKPLLDWFGGKLGLNNKAATAKTQPTGSGQAAEPVYSGGVPPADGRAWVQMAISPDGGALDLVLSAINSAKTSIRIAAYEFTSKPVAQALLAKQKDGVSIMVVLDKSQLTSQYTSATFLANVGIPVRINSRYAIQHSKILVVDGDTVQTGSFNYTDSASRRNSENVLVVWHHPALAKQYGDYWLRLWGEGEPYVARR